MSKELAAFLLQLVNAQQLNAGADDFEQVAALVVEARKMLAEIAADD